VLAIAGLGLAPTGAAAHETAESGSIRVSVGWAEEPAFSGALNAVQALVATAAGDPVSDAGGSLTVEISFGGQVVVLPLLPSGRPGELRAAVIPTSPGTYSFHVTGTVADERIDITSTCSDRTFECVRAATTVQFPATEPAGSEVITRLERELGRAEDAAADADRARTLAAGALTLAVIALLAAAVGFGFRGRRPAD
jgi:hypothetical protein